MFTFLVPGDHLRHHAARRLRVLLRRRTTSSNKRAATFHCGGEAMMTLLDRFVTCIWVLLTIGIPVAAITLWAMRSTN